MPFDAEPIDLKGGLVLRRARRSDVEALAAFNAEFHAPSPDEGNGDHNRAVTESLMLGRVPGVALDDFLVVEDSHHGRIVSSVCVFPLTWHYDGIPFGVMQVEFVGTHPDYRRRGLIRRQFEAIHERCMRDGQLVQVVCGIAWYYRQFGYEYALWTGPIHTLRLDATRPEEKAAAEGLGLRPARPADLDLLLAIDANAAGRYAVWASRGRAMWQNELDGRDRDNPYRRRVLMIEEDGQAIGYVGHSGMVGRFRSVREWLTVFEIELASGQSWVERTPALLGLLERLALDLSGTLETPLIGLRLALGDAHPLTTLLAHRLVAAPSPSWYHLYLRVPDVAAFIGHLAPALEKRLEGSLAAGYSGALEINLYRDGMRLTWESGRLTGVERWSPSEVEAGEVGFPDLTFLKLLFGYRSLAQLEDAYPDCEVRSDRARVLLEALFPQRPSQTWLIV